MIELIVVVAILGVLAAVLTPRVLDSLDNARRNGALAFGKEIQLAMERYYVDHDGGYPTTAEMKAADDTDTAFAYSDLVAVLSPYTTLNEEQFSSESGKGFDYEADLETGASVVNDYEMTVTLLDSGKTLKITPTSVTIQE